MRNQREGSRLESVDRALRLIVMLRDGEVLSVKSAAERLDVVPSTAHRLLGALCDRNFAAQDPERRYRAGPELHERPDDTVSPESLRRAVRPALEGLSDAVGETVQLMVLDGADVLYLDGAECDQVLRVARLVGDRMPAFCSAGGKALLATLTEAEVAEIYPNGLPAWPAARITDIADLNTLLTTVRNVGYGISLNETVNGVSGVGVTVADPGGRPIAALTVAVPSSRFRRSEVRRYVDELRTAATLAQRALCDRSLGSQP